MKSIKKILFSILLIAILLFLCSLTSTVSATVKENIISFDSDTYVIGSTKFDEGFVITASRAAIAGGNEAYVQYNIYGNIQFKPSDIKTLYYCALDESWSEVEEDGEELRELTNEEVTETEENLNIFFVNNEEKTLEVPFDGEIDEESIMGGQIGTAKVQNNKIVIPATWMVNGFFFTSNGTEVEVTLSNTDENENVEELTTPVIKKQPSMSIISSTAPAYAQAPFEFTVKLTANDFENEEVTGNIYCNPLGNIIGYPNLQFEYYNETTETWVAVNDNFRSILTKELKTEEIKCRVTSMTQGQFKIYVNITRTSNASLDKDITVNFTIDPKYVAKIDQNFYETIFDAEQNAQSNSTITLLKNITITERLNVLDKAMTLDLNGKTITIEGPLTRISAKGNAALSIINGNIISTGGYALQSQDNATLIVANNVNVTTPTYGITVWNNATVNCSGIITVTGDGFGIAGNGSETSNTNINVLGGSITAQNGAAIYQPQSGIVNISSGTLTANTVIGIKSGTLNISGGTLNATGEKVAPRQCNNGFEYTGDVIFIEENPAYRDNMTINVTGGTLQSTNGYIIQELNSTVGTANELTAGVQGTYTVKNNAETANCFYYTAE